MFQVPEQLADEGEDHAWSHSTGGVCADSSPASLIWLRFLVCLLVNEG